MIFLIVVSFFFVQFHQNVHIHACEIANDCPNVTSPEQIRVALRSNNTITISWRTSGMPNGTNDTLVPRVKYGLSSDLEDGTIANGTSGTYTKVGIISWFHDVVITVNYSRTYYYQILASLCVSNSTTYSFNSQPAPGNQTPITINIIGDTSVSGNEPLSSQSHKSMDPCLTPHSAANLFLHAGGFTHADENILGNISATYEETWNSYQREMESVTAQNIYMTAPGTHEVTCIFTYDCICQRNIDRNITNQYRNFSAYLNRFSMPGGDSDHTFKNLWYSFDYGLAHIVIINTETDFEGAPAGPNTSLNGGNFRSDNTQVEWLKDDLQRAKNRKDTVPWIIVVGHRPWYGTAPKPVPTLIYNGPCRPCQDAFAEILFNNSVDFYFSAHIHWYQRLWPVYLNATPHKDYHNPVGPIYITTGAGSHAEIPAELPSHDDRDPATAALSDRLGFSQLQLRSPLEARLYYYSLDKTHCLDHAVITRSTPPQTSCSH